jgi:high-affinity nickel permease
MLNPFITAALLGLKHALDPDHLAAVFNMTLSGKVKSSSAAKLGLSWGVGHAISMVLLGLPVILLSSSLPTWFYTSAELGVGIVILYLGLKLFTQWFKGEFHPHNLGNLVKTHADHRKTHKKAGLMGLLHGTGGSYPASLLMLASFSTPATSAVGLLLFVVLTILSMVVVTTTFSYMILHHYAMHVLDRLILPIFIVVTCWFGVTYIEMALKSLGLM